MRLGTFVDLSYLRQSNIDFQIDMKKLSILTQKLAEEHLSNGTKKQISIAKTVVVGSIPTNVAYEDQTFVDKLKTFYNVISTFPCFEVIAVPIDYHGYHMRYEDRQKSQNVMERSFSAVEKAVDTTIVVRMLELMHRDHAVDVACVISGDRDMIPAIKSLNQSGCHVFVAGINIHNTLNSAFDQENIPYFELTDYKTEIERNSNISIGVKNQINELLDEIKNSLCELNEWSKDKLLAKLNIWACRSRLLRESADEQTEEFKILFGLLTKISKEFQPGYVPALKKSYHGQWKSQIVEYSKQLQFA